MCTWGDFPILSGTKNFSSIGNWLVNLAPTGNALLENGWALVPYNGIIHARSKQVTDLRLSLFKTVSRLSRGSQDPLRAFNPIEPSAKWMRCQADLSMIKLGWTVIRR
jgi:hypothetical protein